MNLKKLTMSVAVTGAMMAFGLPQADARWYGSSGSWGSSGSSGSSGSWGSSGSSGSSGSWGSSGSSGSSGSWGSSGSSGSSGGGLFARWRHRRAMRHGSSGSWGSSGSHGSSGSWGSSGSSGSSGSYGSHGSSGGGTVIYDESQGTTPPPEPQGDSVEPSADQPMTYQLDSRSILLAVNVPENARLYVNDAKTKSTGSFRRFVSRGLRPGATYTYTLRAEVDQNGETLSDVKTVKVTGGKATRIAFAFDNQTDEQVAQKPVVTTLTLNVPAEAKVFLAGQPTKSEGQVREFSTTRLTKTGEWADYPVRVELDRNGENLVRTASVSLKAGEKRELTIDFDIEKVARAEK